MAGFDPNRDLCGESDIETLVGTMERDETEGMEMLNTLLRNHPKDPRLLFLKGSMLAQAQDYGTAREMMRRAVDVAPDYAVARFQLGFLLLSEGEGHAAQEAWGPLQSQPKDNYLRMLAEGLTHMLNDRFAEAIPLLQEGMARNEENPPLNGNIQLIIDELRRRMAGTADDAGETETVSAVHMLLQQSAKSTKH